MSRNDVLRTFVLGLLNTSLLASIGYGAVTWRRPGGDLGNNLGSGLDSAQCRCHIRGGLAITTKLLNWARREFMVGLTTRLMTMLTGTFVGRDEDGNSYYRGKARPGRTVERRWVLYKGVVEASRVPPHWHAWLHHMTDQAPSGPPVVYDWQAPHEPNLTGTVAAYRPKGSPTRSGMRTSTTSDYEPWTPN